MTCSRLNGRVKSMTSSQTRCAAGVEVLLLTDLLTQTLDIAEAKTLTS